MVTFPETAIVWSVVPVDAIVIFPVGLPVAVAAIRTYTLVALNVPEAVIVVVDPKPVALFKETSKPVGAVTTTLFVRFVPETAKVWVDEATPEHDVKLDNVEGFIKIEGETTETDVEKLGPTEKSK